MNAKPAAVLASMAALLGEWTMLSPQFPDFRGRSKIEWNGDGGYLMMRDEVDRGEFPSGTWVVGGDDSDEHSIALYHDSRGVSRVYHMTFVDGIWKIWRNAPGFNQRFIGRVDRAGTSIAGQWETSEDASRWEKDFDLVYQKVE